MFKLQRSVKFLVCIGVVTAFFGCQSKPKEATTGQNLDDTVMTTKVKAAILEEPALKTLQIDVTTEKGVVRLSGAVDSSQSVAKAGDLARTVTGVTEVKNDLVVK
jgi:osmotically-inducible protein OsmY